MRHSQALGKRERLERASASSIKKQRDRERLERLQDLQEIERCREIGRALRSGNRTRLYKILNLDGPKK